MRVFNLFTTALTSSSVDAFIERAIYLRALMKSIISLSSFLFSDLDTSFRCLANMFVSFFFADRSHSPSGLRIWGTCICGPFSVFFALQSVLSFCKKHSDEMLNVRVMNISNCFS